MSFFSYNKIDKMKKRSLALCAASLLALTALPVFATDSSKSVSGGITAHGHLEGYVDMDVFSVELPTIPEDTLDFIIDPQDLLQEDSSAYPGATFYEGTGLYFQTSTNVYTENSAGITIVNKSSVPITLSVSASVDLSQEGVSLTDDPEFTNDATPGIYLALTDGITPYPVDAEDETVTMTVTLDAVDESNYEVIYDPVEGYSYRLKPTTPVSEFNSFTFHVTGGCNKDADWGSYPDITAEMEVLWTIDVADTL